MIVPLKVFEDGIIAYNKGEDQDSNPYPLYHVNHVHWNNGWTSGRDESVEEEDEEGL